MESRDAHAEPPPDARRSALMSRVRGRHTSPEMVVRKALHRHGYRYRLHDKRLPGKPDLVLPRLRVVILVHGCFWHRHHGCRAASTPKTRSSFWEEKFARNVERKGLSRSASGSNLSRHFGQFVDVPRGQRDCCSGFCQFQCASASNSLRCSSNQCNATSENAHEPPYVEC